MNRTEFHKHTFNSVRIFAESANGHPFDSEPYRNASMLLSILSTLRDAEELGRSLIKDDDVTFIVAGEMLYVCDTYQELRQRLDSMSNELFGVAALAIDRRAGKDEWHRIC